MVRKSRGDGQKRKLANLVITAKTEKAMDKAIDEVTSLLNQVRLTNAKLAVHWR